MRVLHSVSRGKDHGRRQEPLADVVTCSAHRKRRPQYIGQKIAVLLRHIRVRLVTVPAAVSKAPTSQA